MVSLLLSNSIIICIFQDEPSLEQEHDLKSEGQVCSHDLDQVSHDLDQRSHDPGHTSHDSQSDTEKVSIVGMYIFRFLAQLFEECSKQYFYTLKVR